MPRGVSACSTIACPANLKMAVKILTETLPGIDMQLPCVRTGVDRRMSYAR